MEGTWSARRLCLLLFLLGAGQASAYPDGYDTLVLSSARADIPCSGGDPCTYDPTSWWSGRFSLEGGAGESAIRFVKGDFDQDGMDDVAFSAGGLAVHVLYGRPDGYSGDVSLEDPDVRTFDVAGAGGTGLTVGDVTGDGSIDLIIGAPEDDRSGYGAPRWRGVVYVLPGRAGERWEETLPLEAQPGAFRLVYSVDLYSEDIFNGLGFSLSTGDIGVGTGCSGSTSSTVCTAGDGVSDLVIGAPESDYVVVVYGPLEASASGYLDLRGASNTVTLRGASGSETGYAVLVADSLDTASGQGLADVAVGAPATSSSQGQVILLAGRHREAFLQQLGGVALGQLSASGLNQKRVVTGTLLWTGDGGSEPVGRLGHSLGSLGDLDLDGYADIAIGVPTGPSSTSTGEAAGVQYVLFGSSQALSSGSASLGTSGWSSFTGDIQHAGGTLSVVAGVAGFVTQAESASHYPDLILSAPEDSAAGPNGAGTVWILKGRSRSAWNSSFGGWISSSLTSSIVGGEPGLHVGSGLGAVDLNGDGQDELMLGVFDAGSGQATHVYVFQAADYQDQDGDGQSLAEGDCDDSTISVMYSTAGSNELCDGLDNDCDGRLDDADPSLTNPLYYSDADSDGYGDPTQTGFCSPGSKRVDNGLDCDDTDAQISPASSEQCDSIDNDCDTKVDDEDTSGANTFPVWYLDVDLDGWGSACLEPEGIAACTQPLNHGQTSLDCFDTIYCGGSMGEVDPASIHPEAVEVCDTLDNDCDSLVDEADPGLNDPEHTTTSYPDDDGDGYGGAPVYSCGGEIPVGNILVAGDCNDLRADVSPEALEQCNFMDDDCDEKVDEDLPTAPTYIDYDYDGYGTGEPFGESCAYSGGSWVGGDCNDSDPGVHPEATETCNSLDDDCDGAVDADDLVGMSDVPERYVDADQDGFGEEGSSTPTCEEDEPFSDQDGDCDDSAPEINPDATERCNAGVDDDCDGRADDSDSSVQGTHDFYVDADLDGVGSSDVVSVCVFGDGLSESTGDCDDANQGIYPGAIERNWNSVDEDCDGAAPVIGCSCSQTMPNNSGVGGGFWLLGLGLLRVRRGRGANVGARSPLSAWGR